MSCCSSSSRNFQAVCDILKKHEFNGNKLIPILQEVQEEYRYLPKPILNFIANSLDLPPSKVFGVATFYGHFALKPKGKNVIKVCNGTACHVKGAGDIIDDLRKDLNLTAENNTTSDMLFTLETVSCLGACGLAPVVLNNEKVYGQTDSKEMTELTKELKENN